MTTMDAEAHERASRIALLPMQHVGQKTGFFSGTGKSIAEIWAHRELLWLLVRREIRARYKDSSLGIVWSLVRPLVQLLIYYFAIGQILGAARAVPDFAIFVFIGLTTWGLFAETRLGHDDLDGLQLGPGEEGLSPARDLPAEQRRRRDLQLRGPGRGAARSRSPFLASFPGDGRLWFAPVAIVTLIVFSTAVGLVLSAVNVYLRDTEHLVEIALVVLFWASPIVYSFTFVHNALHGNWVEQIYLANPVTICIIAMQKALWAAGSEATGAFTQAWPDHLALRLAITLLVSLVLVWLAQRIFSRLQGNFAQEL